jgi:hypothetical protein
LSYKLIASNQDWKAKWFYITDHHPELPKPSGKQPKHRAWWNTKPKMQEGIQLPELMQKIQALREAGLRAEHVAFSFMKRRVQPLMACDTLGYQYTSDEDTSRMPGVIEPPKIIPYYRLSWSTWPLSNNKELFCRFRRVKPGESLTIGSRYALSPHEGGTIVQHYITKKFTSSTLLQTRFFILKSKHGSKFKQRKVNYTHDTHRRPSMHITPHHRSPIQAPNHLGENQAKWDYLKTTTKARMSILILGKTYPTKRKYD